MITFDLLFIAPFIVTTRYYFIYIIIMTSVFSLEKTEVDKINKVTILN